MNDNFSFSRLALVWRCYSPGMGKQLLLTGGLTLVAYLVSFMATQVVWGILLYGMMSYVTTITYPCIAFAVRQNYDVAGKVWGMTSAEIEQHAVVTGNRIYFHFGNHRNHYAFSSFVLCTLLQMPILK